MMSFGVAPRGERSGLLMQEFGAFAVTYSPVVEIYWYFTGIYHIFDYFGKWYGKRKSGMVNWFDCLGKSRYTGSRSAQSAGGRVSWHDLRDHPTGMFLSHPTHPPSKPYPPTLLFLAQLSIPCLTY